MDTEMNTTEKANSSFSQIKEDQLSLEMSPVEKDTANSEINNCNDHLAINGRSIKHLFDQVTVDALEFLRDQSLRLQSKTDPLLNFVTGLKLHFAINNDGLVLLYQPVYMTRQPSSMGEPFYDVITGDFYTYDQTNNQFVSVSASDAYSWTNGYKRNIGIKHRLDTTFTSFIQGLDTEAAIFPFQTIVALYSDNSVSSVFFYNSIRQEPVGGSYSVKHCLLLSSEKLELNSNSFAGKLANRSHLCPPSCNSLQYALIK